MPGSNCFVCSDKVQRVEDGISCGACSRILHARCSGMSEKDLESFQTLSPVQKKSWTCSDCGSQRRGNRKEGNSSSSDYASDTLLRKMDALHSRFDRVDDALARIEKLEIDARKMEKRLDEHDSAIAKLRVDNGTLWSTVGDLQSNNSNEPPCDLKAIEIYGLKISKSERLIDVAVRVLLDALDMVVEERDIDDCIFIEGRKPADGLSNGAVGGPSNQAAGGGKFSSDVVSGKSNGAAHGGIFIIRFMSRRMRENALRAWKSKRSSGSGVEVDGWPVRGFGVGERLSRDTRRILKETKIVARRLGWKYVWTRRGSVLVRKQEGGNYFIVNSVGSLKSLAK